jgi:hypothetical protein
LARYLISEATSSFVQTNPFGKRSASWNSRTNTLTSSQFDAGELQGFTFHSENNWQFPEFSVLVRDENATVRRGVSFSCGEQLEIFEILGHHEQAEDNDDDVSLKINDELELKVVVTTSVKDVHHWRIIELFVDAVDVKQLPAIGRRISN